MREGSKTSIAALIALLLALGLVACGGGGDSDSSAAEAISPGQAGGSASDNHSASSHFVPKPHDDSGGGSAQFRVKGGDNSIQEFGAEADESDFEEAAVALHGFLDARAAEDWSAACDYLAASIAKSLQQLTASNKELKGKGCPALLEVLSGGVPRSSLEEAAQADVASLRVEGDRSFIIYRGAKDTVFAVPMEREDGSWKVASLAGTPLS